MKRLFFLFLSISFILLIQSCTQDSPVAYNDSIIDHQRKIVEKIDNLKKAIDNYNVLPADVALEEMDIAYNQTIVQIDSGIVFLNGIESFKSDTSFKKSAFLLFKNYKSVVETEYKQIIEIYRIPQNLYSQEDGDKLDQLNETSTVKLNNAYDVFLTAQAKFAEDNNLVLE